MPGLSGDQMMQAHITGHGLTTSNRFLTTFAARWSARKPAKHMNNYHLTTSYHLFLIEDPRGPNSTIGTSYRKQVVKVVRWSVVAALDVSSVTT